MRKLIILALVMAVMAFLSYLFLDAVIHAEDFLRWLTPLPLFFFAIGWASQNTLQHFCVANKQKYLVTVYLGVHIVKMLLIAAFITFYLVLLNVVVWQLLLILLLFYLVHLVWETKLFFSYEKQLKNEHTTSVQNREPIISDEQQ